MLISANLKICLQNNLTYATFKLLLHTYSFFSCQILVEVRERCYWYNLHANIVRL